MSWHWGKGGKQRKKGAFPIKISSWQLHGYTSRNTFNSPNPSFLQALEKRAYFAQRRDFRK